MHLICKSEEGRVRSKGFHTHHWLSSSNSQQTNGKTFWNVDSRMKKFRFIQFLKMKAIFEGLNLVEQRCLYDGPGVLNDELFISALKAKISGTSLNTLDIRLYLISQKLEKPRYDNQLFLTWKGISAYCIKEFDKAIRPPKKFSGYIKSPSAAGSKRMSLSHPDPEILDWSSIEEIDYYTALTVGDLYLGKSLVIHLPDDEPNKVRNGQKFRFNV
jgi:hypothetical protein